jgi:hypothetical protein
MLKHILILLVACLVPCDISAKCGNSIIAIDGRVSDPAAGSTVSAQIVPDSNWKSKPATVDADGQFHLTVYFDRLETGTWRAWLTELYKFERCSREPKTVTVQLYRNGQLVDQVALQFGQDFVDKGRNADFNIRSPITLHSR